jgi:hypothetical protein
MPAAAGLDASSGLGMVFPQPVRSGSMNGCSEDLRPFAVSNSRC